VKYVTKMLYCELENPAAYITTLGLYCVKNYF